MAELTDLQARIERTRAERGFTTEPLQLFTLLTEEVGEVATELKKTWSANYDDPSPEDLASELADVFVLLSAIATRFDVDLETAVESKFFTADAERDWATATATATSTATTAGPSAPSLIAVCIDATDARRLGEFYRQLLGYSYRAGDEAPADGQPDPSGEDWLVLLDGSGTPRLAIQQVDELAPASWPDPSVPQQLHLDMSVGSVEELLAQHERVIRLGARMLEDRSESPEESLIVYADPAGHPFCILVSPPV